MDITNHNVENETILTNENKSLERKDYVKKYNTAYYKANAKVILEQKKEARKQKLQEERLEEIRLWREKLLNSDNPFTLVFEKS